MNLKDVFRLQTQRGEQIRFGDSIVTPEVRALVIRWPNGGFVRAWPTALWVERGGQVRRLRILDMTRLIQVGLLATTVLFALALRSAVSRKPSQGALQGLAEKAISSRNRPEEALG
jgi:hypothetical protein